MAVIHVLSVWVVVENDDQSDPEAVVEAVEAALERERRMNLEENGVAWPVASDVIHVREWYTPTYQKRKRSIDGKALDADGGGKAPDGRDTETVSEGEKSKPVERLGEWRSNDPDQG